MSPTLDVSEELLDRIDVHRMEGESREEVLSELLHHYEAEGNLLWEGYGGPP